MSADRDPRSEADPSGRGGDHMHREMAPESAVAMAAWEKKGQGRFAPQPGQNGPAALGPAGLAPAGPGLCVFSKEHPARGRADGEAVGIRCPLDLAVRSDGSWWCVTPSALSIRWCNGHVPGTQLSASRAGWDREGR